MITNNKHDMAVHTIEICAGVGMLGEGLRAGLDYLGIPLRTVCYVEREAYAAAVLAARCEEGSLDDAPVWSDLLTFDAGAWRGAVDGIVAGFPCQDLSLAGRRAGLDGKRSGLFFNILDIADACGAQFLFLENVAGIASATASVVDEAEGALEERAAARVVGELADRGWDAEWLTLSASEVGASHGRERWFCLAWRRVGNAGLQHQYVQQWADGAEHQGAGQPVAHAERAERWPGSVGGTGSQQGNDGIGRQADGGAGEPDEALGYTNSGAARCELQQRGCTCGNDAWKLQPGQPEFPGLSMGYPECPRWPQAGRGPEQHAGGEPEPGCGAVADAECQRSKTRVSGSDNWQEGIANWVTDCGDSRPFFAPGPADPRWPAILERWPYLAPATEPGFRGILDGLEIELDSCRTARLRCVGNGVVALCAAAALVVLMRRAGVRPHEA